MDILSVFIYFGKSCTFPSCIKTTLHEMGLRTLLNKNKLTLNATTFKQLRGISQLPGPAAKSPAAGADRC
jgi:L-arabinose isomerase